MSRYELRLARIAGRVPDGYILVPNGEKIPEYVGPLAGEYPAMSLIACALNANAEAAKNGTSERGLQYYIHPQQKAA